MEGLMEGLMKGLMESKISVLIFHKYLLTFND